MPPPEAPEPPPAPPLDPVQDRAAGALWGLAIGDALGMPTQLLSRADVVDRYGPLITGFLPADASHPIAGGMPAGSVTDDTEQALLLARLLVAGSGRIEPRDFAEALLDWESGMRARGSLDLLGPSTKRACEAIRAGVAVEEAGRAGDTNGAAMRIAPLGVAYPADDPVRLVEQVVAVSAVTHGTGLALAGGAAVAAAVSAAVAGSDHAEARAAAVTAAGLGARKGVWVAGADVAARIVWACDLISNLSVDDGVEQIVTLVGTSLAIQESVPAAFAVLELTAGDPWLAVRVAASLGGDADTIAAMAGAVAGAVRGVTAFPPDAVSTVREVNGGRLDDLDELVTGLLGLRRRATT